MLPVLLFIAASKAATSDELQMSERLISSTDIKPSVQVVPEQIEQLEKAFENNDFSELEQRAVGAFPDGCPPIYSAWYCERLAESDDKTDKERSGQQRRLRKLGGMIFNQLRLEGARLSRRDLTQEHFLTQARRFLRLSDWFAKGDAYGNGMLAARCRFAAGVALGHLIVESNISIEELQPMIANMERFDELEYLRWIVRAHEQEVPGGLAPFVKKEHTPHLARVALARSIIRAYNRLANTYGIEVSKIGNNDDVIRKLRSSLPVEMAFYLEDQSKPSLEAQWDHYTFVPGSCETYRFAKELGLTIFFRKAVGGFPLKPLPDDALVPSGELNPRYFSIEHAAFSRAWNEFCHNEAFLNSDLKKDPASGKMVVDPQAENLSAKYYNMGAAGKAARIFEAVKTGRFMSYLPIDPQN